MQSKSTEEQKSLNEACGVDMLVFDRAQRSNKHADYKDRRKS